MYYIQRLNTDIIDLKVLMVTFVVLIALYNENWGEFQQYSNSLPNVICVNYTTDSFFNDFLGVLAV